MTAEIVQFIPRARNRADSDFPAIVFKGPVAPSNSRERDVYDYTPSEYVAPEQDPA